MTGPTFKDRVFGELAVLGRALANPHRLELLDLLAQGARNVEELARESRMSLANTSAHLQVLRRGRLVEAEKHGLHVRYRLASPGVFELYRTLRDLGSAHLAELDRLVETYFRNRDELHLVDKEELLRQVEQRVVTVVDVRPFEEFEQGHILHARSIPLAELERRLAELPTDREVVAYCRGPYCLLSDEALTLLLARGFRARRLSEGLPEWRAAGYPVGTIAS
jgi:rhodanese-related sulfurtransferase/DNA-binding transcriptional ArsR family regulator